MGLCFQLLDKVITSGNSSQFQDTSFESMSGTDDTKFNKHILSYANVTLFNPATMRTAECIKGIGRQGFWTYNLTLPESCWSKMICL